jgi:hypothetical protein
MHEILIQVVGYISSALLALSLLVSNDLKFRWLNTGGCVFFIAYGVMIGALPVILTNSLLFLINLYYLIKLFNAQEDFDLIEFKGDERLVSKFISFYQNDIHSYFPLYTHGGSGEQQLKFAVLRDLVIANIFIATLREDGTAFVQLNYTVEKYRDYKVGRFIFNRENKFLLSKGVKQLVYRVPVSARHEKFLKVMGFKREHFENEEFLVRHL